MDSVDPPPPGGAPVGPHVVMQLMIYVLITVELLGRLFCRTPIIPRALSLLTDAE